MRLTQGTFSYLPDLTDEQIAAQVQYALDRDWPISHALPMFDVRDAAAIMDEVRAARTAHGDSYIQLNAYDARLGRQTTALSFIVQRPAREPGFRVERTADKDRQIKYRLHPYSADKPQGERYGSK